MATFNGGGIIVSPLAKGTLINSTISGNSASSAGAISSSGTVTATYLTIAFNSGDGGAVRSLAGTFTLEGTIVSDSSAASSCYGTMTDRGHNLSSDDSCGFSQ